MLDMLFQVKESELILNKYPKSFIGNPEEVRTLIGFAGYFRRFIQNFSQTSKPLTEVFPSTSKCKKKKKVKE